MTLCSILIASVAFLAAILALIDESWALTTGCKDRYSQGGACCNGDIEIDSSVTYLMFGFQGCSITSVIIPNSLTSINGGAFANNKLTSIIIPDSVTYIGNSAFASNKLLSVVIGKSVNTIGNGAFQDNQITTVTIPASVTNIGYGAFMYNNITSVTIPSTVNSVDSKAFFYNHITSHIVESPNTYLGAYAFDGQFGHLQILDGTTAIESNAFGGNKLLSIGIPPSVTSIGDGAFSNNRLTSITLPGSVTSIGVGAFQSNQITYVTIPASVVVISGGAFMHNKITSVTIPSTVNSVDSKAFYNNRITSYTVESSNTYIGSYAFNAQFGHLIIPDGATSVENYAFLGNQLTSVTIPDSVTSIGEYAFRDNRLVSIIIPDGVTSIGYQAFYGNLLTSATIPNSVTSIATEAFMSNKFTILPAIPSSITYLTGFSNNLLTSVVIPDTVTSIGSQAFANNLLTSVTIPTSVTSIESGAFASNLLTTVTIPDSVTSMKDYAFIYNELKSIFIPSSVTSIGHAAFYQNKIKSIIISASVLSVLSEAFSQNPIEFACYMGNTPPLSNVFGVAFEQCLPGILDPTNQPSSRPTSLLRTPTPTHRPTLNIGRPAKGIKFRSGSRSDNNVGGDEDHSTPPPAFVAYINSEETTDKSPDANIEYHCFEHEARYVRGTYGMRGYFEGKLDGHTAYVNFFEITNDGETLTPSTGSAAITYSDDWLSSVDGPFWNSGSSTMPGSWGRWGALESCVNCFSSDMSMKRIRKEKCLWSDNEHSHYNKLPDLSDRIMGSEQTANNWFNIGYGPSDTLGHLVGSYHYTYTEKQCNNWGYNCSGKGFDEVGMYGSHTVSANVKGGRILASDLQIHSGPLSGHIGSGLYLIYNYKDGSVGYTGFFCSGDWLEASGSGNMKLVLVDCAYDAGDEMADDSDQAVHLLGAGYDNLWNYYSIEWQRLHHFFNAMSQ